MTKDARQFLTPMPPGYVDAANLSGPEQAELERERSALIQSLSRLGFAARTRSEQRIKEIERLLAVARGDLETGRRTREREEERKREQGQSVQATFWSLNFIERDELMRAVSLEMKRVGMV
jgi:hypothetical protein